MSPTTRAASARKRIGASEPRPKRRKTSKPSNKTEDAAADLTAENSVQSPLLRLPAELRNKIWRYAFGEMALRVNAFYFMIGTKSASRLEYSLLETYDAEAQLASKRNQVPGLVCRQYWSEASEVFFSSCTFMFSARALEEFVLHRQIVSRVRRLSLRLYLFSPHPIHLGEPYALPATTVEKLTSLERLHFQLYCDPFIQRHIWSLDIMNDPVWVKSRIPHTIRAFQQHQLKEAFTKVTFLYQNTPRTREVCAKVQSHLLEYRPRRVSHRKKEPNDV